LGYVGCVTGACLGESGHTVWGVDVNETKVNMINNGKAPIVEKDIDQLMNKVVQNKSFTATTDYRLAVEKTDLSLICVGTPSRSNGSIDLGYIKRVVQNIGTQLRHKSTYFVVVIRSTVLPGTVEETVIPILEMYSGKKAGVDFGVCVNPEFLREGTSISDFYHPAKSVIGEIDKRSGDHLLKIYENIKAPVIRTKIKIAEMVKYTDNIFHGLKVTFANEIGTICKEMKIDSHEVMDIFCMDTKLNLSPHYLKPGFAFGGSCLPKDLRALLHESKIRDVEMTVIGSILESNKRHIAKVVSLLSKYKGKSMGFIGMSFKGGTDDLRESPVIEVIETLLGKGFKIQIYDKYVSLARLVGANKDYIEREIPHISLHMKQSLDDLVSNSEVIVICNQIEESDSIFKMVKKEQIIIDLARVVKNYDKLECQYQGICW
ncbi:MAG TPA: nucleotide sugar dehydrogenase, partial [Chitinispirillaceae bacterium]|nr:nucleotide sugar dehydrogenase [Chitinispirillaceae bacterium]